MKMKMKLKVLMMVCLVLTVVFFKGSLAYIEVVEEEGSESRMFLLTCRHLHSTLAILEAKFHPEENDKYRNSSYPFSPENPRLALNKRCSGVNHCSFILNKDCPGAELWGRGNFYIKYACVSDKNVQKFCNKEIRLSSHQHHGFIRNPGYPRFYLGKHECRWVLRAPPMQRVRIVILDLSIVERTRSETVDVDDFGIVTPDEGDEFGPCLDQLQILDSQRTIYSSCEQSEPPKEITSVGDSLEIRLVTTEILIPRRGILIQYSTVGCETPLPPQNGYLVHRNDSAAVFSCCIGFIFPKFRSRLIALNCLGRSWNLNLPLPKCENITADNHGHINIISLGKKPTTTDTMENSSVTDVIVVPSLVITALFLLNAIIVFVIYKYRQRKTALYTDEELNPIPYTSEIDSP